MIEVELKARVRDREATIAAVASFATFVGELDKRDEYWLGPETGATAVAIGGSLAARRDFRLRREAGKSLVTFKDKAVRDGVETNVEVEFGVDDPESFEALALRLGCRRWYEKRKRGLRYETVSSSAASGTATIEIAEIEGLGHFIEIEIMVDEGDTQTIAAARLEVRGILADSGVPETDIESRFYSELLGKRDR